MEAGFLTGEGLPSSFFAGDALGDFSTISASSPDDILAHSGWPVGSGTEGGKQKTRTF